MLSDALVQEIVKYLLGGGAAGMLAMFGRALWKARTGRMQRERAENTSIVNQRIQAIEERDIADDKRRRAMDEVNRLRGILLRNGIDPGEEIDLGVTVTHKRPKSARGSTAAERR